MSWSFNVFLCCHWLFSLSSNKISWCEEADCSNSEYQLFFFILKQLPIILPKCALWHWSIPPEPPSEFNWCSLTQKLKISVIRSYGYWFQLVYRMGHKSLAKNVFFYNFKRLRCCHFLLLKFEIYFIARTCILAVQK